MDGSAYFKSLLLNYMNGTASEAELGDLFDEISQGKDTEEWESMIREITMSATPDPGYDKSRFQPLIDRIVRPKSRIYSVRWAAAAALILLLGSYFLLFRKSGKVETPMAQAKINDVAPGGNKAVLTLGNGTSIILNNAANGLLSRQGNTNIIKTDSGKLSYQTNKSIAKEIVFNTLSTPRGGQYELTLPDGTKVWLNAASSITYPTAFTGKERRVTVTGEVYMEVIHNNRQPFVVTVNDVEIRDVGTRFNINAYPDEKIMQTTVLEGSVDVTAFGQSELVRRGEQARIGDSWMGLADRVDLDQVMAWKNGMFDFQDADIKTVMRQLSRWYDVEVVYSGQQTSRHFNGEIGRSLTLSQVLKGLSSTGIHFNIEGKTITMTQLQ
jgi:transmembrane sensor